MLTIKESNNLLLIKCAYLYKDRVKKLPGARFDFDKKVWTIPKSSLPFLCSNFHGELYFKTPLWKIKGEKEPPKGTIQFYKKPQQIPELQLKPFNYQEEAIRFAIDRLETLGFCLIADQMGLGKSLESTGAMKWYKDNRNIKRILIICSKSLKFQWKSELERYTGWTDIHATGETPKKRSQAYEAVKDEGILIANYHNFLNDIEEIKQIDFDLCVIDEAHNVKARNGKMNNLIASITQNRKTILMTGTPIMSRPDDIYGIVQLGARNYFGSYAEFEEHFLVIENGLYGRQIVGARNLDLLQQLINDFMIRRTTDDIREDLPAVLPPIKILAETDNIQKKIMAFIETQKDALNAKKEQLMAMSDTQSAIEELNEKSKMYIAASQFVADDPKAFFLGPKSRIKDNLAKMVPNNYKISNKTEATLDLVQNMRDADEKVVIFCQYTTTAFMLKDLIEEKTGEEVLMYTGRENTEQREINKARFKEEANILIATSAGEAGLNLQVARYIINYEQPETYASRGQRLGRIRRIDSQFDEVRIYDIITKNSFDEIRYNKIMRDKDLTDALIG